MSKGWETVRIHEIAKVVGGATPNTSVPEYWDGGIPWLTPKDLSLNPARYTSFGTRSLTTVGLAACSAALLPKGSILISSRAPIGFVTIANVEISTNQGFKSLILNDGQDSLFWYYLMSASKDYLEKFANGSTFKEISGATLGALEFTIPKLEEQVKISKALGAIDDLIQNNEFVISQIRSLSSAIYSHAKRGSFSKIRIGDVALVSARRCGASSLGKLTYLDIASLGDGKIDWPEETSWQNAPSRARNLADNGSTLWSNVRPNRRAHSLLVTQPDNLVVSTGITVLTPKEIGPAELFVATDEQAFVDYLVSRADGSAYPAVTGGVFADALISDLGSDASKIFESKVWPLLEYASALHNENRKVSKVRDELLPLLLTGAIKVKEVAA